MSLDRSSGSTIRHTIDSRMITGVLTRFRARRPRVHCITNSAAVNFTANVLLAAGAVPSMTVNPEEVPDFVASADALLVNLGTLDPLRRAAIEAAVAVAAESATPWALDPVFVERSRPRLALARQLVARKPTVIRGNRSELAALTGRTGDDQSARDRSADDRFADDLARAARTTVVRTGEIDYVSDGDRSVRIAGGHRLLASVTATGCAATALLAGFLAVEQDAVTAAATGLAFVAAAADRAGPRAAGPGSFVPAFLDALHALDPDEVGMQARMS